jgi:hypothetical protein
VIAATRPTPPLEVVMALPNPDEVKSWGGKLLVDRAGLPIGTVTQVYTDDDTGLPEWATTRLGEATVFLPLEDAVESDGQIRVIVHRDDVAKAPLVVDKHHISPEEEARLYRYYGIEYAADRSASGLPAGNGPAPARARAARDSTLTALTTAGRRLGDRRSLLLPASLAALAAGVLGVVWTALRHRRSAGVTRAADPFAST